MKFNKFKTRKGRLEEKIELELKKPNPQLKNIIQAVEAFEKDNLDTIEKLKRVRHYESNRINGALKQCINSHGPITKVLIGSATKRIHGALLQPKENTPTVFYPVFKKVMKILALIGLVWMVIQLILQIYK
jgi:hypothetical protein